MRYTELEYQARRKEIISGTIRIILCLLIFFAVDLLINILPELIRLQKNTSDYKKYLDSIIDLKAD
jgi:hypothetical protein